MRPINAVLGFVFSMLLIGSAAAVFDLTHPTTSAAEAEAPATATKMTADDARRNSRIRYAWTVRNVSVDPFTGCQYWETTMTPRYDMTGRAVMGCGSAAR